MYSEKVMDHFANPRNSGIIENASGEGTVGNPTCGDLMTIYIDVDDNEVIQDIKFENIFVQFANFLKQLSNNIFSHLTLKKILKNFQKPLFIAKKLYYNISV